MIPRPDDIVLVVPEALRDPAYAPREDDFDGPSWTGDRWRRTLPEAVIVAAEGEDSTTSRARALARRASAAGRTPLVVGAMGALALRDGGVFLPHEVVPSEDLRLSLADVGALPEDVVRDGTVSRGFSLSRFALSRADTIVVGSLTQAEQILEWARALDPSSRGGLAERVRHRMRLVRAGLPDVSSLADERRAGRAELLRALDELLQDLAAPERAVRAARLAEVARGERPLVVSPGPNAGYARGALALRDPEGLRTALGASGSPLLLLLTPADATPPRVRGRIASIAARPDLEGRVWPLPWPRSPSTLARVAWADAWLALPRRPLGGHGAAFIEAIRRDALVACTASGRLAGLLDERGALRVGAPERLRDIKLQDRRDAEWLRELLASEIASEYQADRYATRLAGQRAHLPRMRLCPSEAASDLPPRAHWRTAQRSLGR